MRRILGSLVLVGAVAFAPTWVSGASAQEDRAFTAYAEATVFNMQYGVPGFILTDKFMDQGGPTAQARFESAGARRANAQIPYMGFAADYPGLIATGGGPAGLPQYPGRALADDATTPEQVVGSEGSPYFLQAKVSDTGANSIARLGAPPGGEGASAPASISKTDILNADGKLTVLAETTALGFSLGPLTVQSLHSKSLTTYTQGAEKPVTETELIVHGVSAGGQEFNIGSDAAEGVAELNKALAPSGIEVHFAGGRTLAGGAAAGSFEVVQTHDTPGAGQGQGVFRVRFGGVISAIDLGSSGSDDSDEVVISSASPPAAPLPVGVPRRPEPTR